MESLGHFFDGYRLNILMKHYSRISKEANIFKDATVVDVGGGEGKGDLLIVKEGPRFLIILDKDFTSLKNARTNLSHFENKSLVCSDGELLPLKDKSVDIVIFRDILHHLLHARDGIIEGIRVSRKAVFIDEPAAGRMRDFMNSILVSFKIKDRYEIREGRELKFRIDHKLLKGIKDECGVRVFCFPYFFYQLKFFERIRSRYFNFILEKIFIALNVILPIKNRAVVIILPAGAG